LKVPPKTKLKDHEASGLKSGRRRIEKDAALVNACNSNPSLTRQQNASSSVAIAFWEKGAVEE